MPEQITYDQACAQSAHDFIWHARLRSGEVIWEQPGVSSDTLPVDEVIGIDYYPVRRDDLPSIEATVRLDKGERFVRYWTTLWKPTGRGTQRLYVLGVQRGERYALLCHYPQYNKLLLATTRPFQPAWLPEPFSLLPTGAATIGGPGTAYFGWVHEGFGGLVEIFANKRLTFRAIYETVR